MPWFAWQKGYWEVNWHYTVMPSPYCHSPHCPYRPRNLSRMERWYSSTLEPPQLWNNRFEWDWRSSLVHITYNVTYLYLNFRPHFWVTWRKSKNFTDTWLVLFYADSIRMFENRHAKTMFWPFESVCSFFRTDSSSLSYKMTPIGNLTKWNIPAMCIVWKPLVPWYILQNLFQFWLIHQKKSQWEYSIDENDALRPDTITPLFRVRGSGYMETE